MTKAIGIKELYLEYPDKIYDITSNTVPNPYFPKDQLTYNKNSLTYPQWKKIIVCYLKHVVKYFLTGKPFKIPAHLGKLQLKKYKPGRKPIDWLRTNKIYGEHNKLSGKGEKKFIYHKNTHTQGYSPILKWYRGDKKYPFQWHWRFKWAKGVGNYVSQIIDKDITIINKWIEA